MAEEHQATYRAFLIRVWREGEAGWRGTVEDPHSGQRRAFADIDQMLGYIREQVMPAEGVSSEPE